MQQLFGRFCPAPCAPPQVSFNTAIAACDKLGDANAAVRLLRQAREADIVPDVFSYNTVISALGHSSLWEVGSSGVFRCAFLLYAIAFFPTFLRLVAGVTGNINSRMYFLVAFTFFGGFEDAPTVSAFGKECRVSEGMVDGFLRG